MRTIFRWSVFTLCLFLSSNTAYAQFRVQDWFSASKDLPSAEVTHMTYVAPVSNPIFNETPFITSEIRPIYIHHVIPDDSVTLGGYANVYALQVRLAITDRLGFIATKDGYTDWNFTAALPDTEGWNNIAGGLKYVLFSNPQDNFIFTGGVRYEGPSGNQPTAGIDLAGADGDGLIDLFVSTAKSWGKLGLEANIGTNLALDGDKNSSLLHYSIHADYEVLPKLFAVLEVNGYTTIDHGKVIALDLEGGDVTSIGTTKSGTLVTLGIGARYQLTNNWNVGAAIEPAISGREDLHENRLTVDSIYTF